MCEWFGAAPFEHPQPADASTLKELFPAYDAEFVSPVKPRVRGETYAQMVGRVRDAMRALIKRCDEEGRKSVVICSHAAVIIVLGRVLTGQHPEEMETEDFKAFTCGLSVYARGRANEKSDNGEYHVRMLGCCKDGSFTGMTGNRHNSHERTRLTTRQWAAGSAKRIATAASSAGAKNADGTLLFPHLLILCLHNQ